MELCVPLVHVLVKLKLVTKHISIKISSGVLWCDQPALTELHLHESKNTISKNIPTIKQSNNTMESSPIRKLRLPPSVNSPESPLCKDNMTVNDLKFLKPFNTTLSSDTTTTSSVSSITTTTSSKPNMDVLIERQHIQNPLPNYTSYFTTNNINELLVEQGTWLDQKEKSCQARLVLAEKRMLRRLTSKFGH